LCMRIFRLGAEGWRAKLEVGKMKLQMNQESGEFHPPFDCRSWPTVFRSTQERLLGRIMVSGVDLINAGSA
jgi:hypothetical protein